MSILTKIKLQHILVTALLTFVMISCAENKTRPDLMADLDKTDSIELIFFRSPDSVRYFTYLPLTDKKFIGTLVQQMKQDTIPEISCMKEGKIYLFRNGEIFNTVFFGYADQECNFLRYIKNGRLYCYPLSADFREQLRAKKNLSKEPLVPDSAGVSSRGPVQGLAPGPLPYSSN